MRRPTDVIYQIEMDLNEEIVGILKDIRG